jgi:LysR family cys regulon transcriptional activator
LDAAFGKEGMTPNVVVTAVDADVIKAYVKLGVGVGIVARMAYNRGEDRGLSTMDADHLFEESVTRVGFRPDIHMTGYKFAFLRLLAPHFTRKIVEKSLSLPPGESATLIKPSDLPLR